jgi:hypothetical protein
MSDPKNRPTRTPLGERNVLTVANKRPDYEQRWVNDVDDRIERANAAGYTAVMRPTKVGDPKAGAATQVGGIVRRPVGGGITAVLMEIPEEYFREDQAAKEAKLKDTERSLLSEAKEGEFYGEGVRIGKSLGKARPASQRVQIDED